MGMWKSVADAMIPPALDQPYQRTKPRKKPRILLYIMTEEMKVPVFCSYCKRRVEVGEKYYYDEFTWKDWHVPCHQLYRLNLLNWNKGGRSLVRKPTEDEVHAVTRVPKLYIERAGVEEPTEEQKALALEVASYYPGGTTFESLFGRESSDDRTDSSAVDV